MTTMPSETADAPPAAAAPVYDARGVLAGVPWPPRKLDVGSGVWRRDHDYTTVDAFVNGVDYKTEMWDMKAIGDNSIDLIWCAHTLEHVACADVARTLKEFLRVLRPKSRAIIQVPNFDYVAKYWLTGSDRSWAEKMVFGLQSHDGEYHKSAHTNGSLRADLTAAGFVVERVELRWNHDQETLQAVAHKPKAGEVVTP